LGDGASVKHVLITGASSGLGAALTRHYAATADRLSLFGRSAERLTKVASSVQRPGLHIDWYVLDVCDALAMSKAVGIADTAMAVDLAIANAGIGGMISMVGPFGEAAAGAHQIASTNFVGVINTIAPLVAPMIGRKRGKIVVVSSLSAFSPMPMAPTYGAAKAGVSAYARNLGHFLRPHGVKVTLVEPGFIETPMSQELSGPQPFKVTADEAAKRIARAVALGKARLTFPLSLAFLAWLAQSAPNVVVDSLSARWWRGQEQRHD
jgi:short-subunit dehydrogenase